MQDVAQASALPQPALAGQNGAVRRNGHVGKAGPAAGHLGKAKVQQYRIRQPAGAGKVDLHVVLFSIGHRGAQHGGQCFRR